MHDRFVGNDQELDSSGHIDDEPELDGDLGVHAAVEETKGGVLTVSGIISLKIILAPLCLTKHTITQWECG